ncbi:MAG: HupE/UreJ family protein [Gammaproteobacteria bacterium]
MAQAHRLRPAIATVDFDAAGGYSVSLQLNLEAAVVGIGPEHSDTNESDKAPEYDALRELPPAELRARFEAFAPRLLAGITTSFDGQPGMLQLVDVDIPSVGDVSVERLSVVRLAGKVPAGATDFSWRYAQQFGECALRVAQNGEVIRSEWLTGGAQSEPFPLDPAAVGTRSSWQVFKDYTVLGFTHILPKGLDHILFVLGIFLLSLHWRPLLYQVTAFTVAHSITLALSLYGIVSLPASVVEPLIAASIVYVAVENIVTPQLKPWRVYVVFMFGLLHGLGFAGVLTDLGLPRDEFVTALIAFNVGVELGQLAVIALAFLAIGLWFRNRSWYRKGIEIPASLAIAVVGAYWTIERIFF